MLHRKDRKSEFSKYKRNLKRSLRSIESGRLYSIINISGLSIGLACSFIIILFIIAETGFDKCHKSRDSIFRLTFHYPEEGRTELSPFFSPEGIKQSVPSLEHSVLMGPIKSTISIDSRKFETQGKGIEGDLFEMFTIPILSGNSSGLNNNMNSIVISNELKTKLFGPQTAEGNTIYLNIQDSLVSFLVIGVIEDLPMKSSLQADFFIQYHHLNYIQKTILGEHYIQIPIDRTKEVTTRLQAVLENAPVDLSRNVQVVLQPLKEIHFSSGHISNNRSPGGDMNKIFIVACIGLLILSCSVINYVILASSRTMEKSKEIAIYKVFGARTRDVLSLIINESILLAFITFPVAIALSHLFLRYAKQLLRNDLSINYSENWIYVLLMLAITLFVGLISGSYTAFTSSRLSPIEGLSRRMVKIKKNTIQKVLLIIQIGIFSGLIMFSILIKKQLGYLVDYDMGFSTDRLVNVNVQGDITYDQYLLFSNMVNSVSGIIDCTYGSDIPQTGGSYGVAQHFVSKEKTVPIEYVYAGPHYLQICGIELISGRYFESDRNEDGYIIVNETAKRLLGIDDPIGKEIENGIIIGIVKDFILHSLHSEIPALIIQQNDSSRISNILIYTEAETNEIITNSVRTVWNELFPELLISIESFSDVFEDMYEREIKMDKTISLFAILAMIISSLGLFGMAHFTTRKRIKEIGLRKVNGANTKDIISLIHRESLIPYLISIICFLPLTYIFALEWYANFTHSSAIGFWDIIISILASFMVFSTPIIFISYKASTDNPIKTLKYE